MSGPTWDGLLALTGGILAFLAILIQVHFSNRGLWTQLQNEESVRARERHRKNRTTATAILFEIDDFYRAYIRDVRSFLEDRSDNGAPPVIKSAGKNPFPVFEGNTQQLGGLNQQLVEAVVHFYGLARAYAMELDEYSNIFAAFQPAPDQYKRQILKSQVPRIMSQCQALAPFAFITCKFLCDYAETVFEAPRIAVAADSHISSETREVAQAGLADFLPLAED
jgi:hypothetical protein